MSGTSSSNSNVIFNSINVNSQGPNGGVFIGDTTAPGWDSHNKIQLSVGKIYNAFGGFNHIPGNLFLLFDNDVIDTMISDPDLVDGSSGD